MTINWHQQYPESWNMPHEHSSPLGYSLPAELHLTITQSNLSPDNLHKLAEEILSDPLSMEMFTQRVYELMQQESNLQNDRLDYR